MRLFSVVQTHGGVSGSRRRSPRSACPADGPAGRALEVPDAWAKAILAAVDTLGIRAAEGW